MLEMRSWVEVGAARTQPQREMGVPRRRLAPIRHLLDLAIQGLASHDSGALPYVLRAVELLSDLDGGTMPASLGVRRRRGGLARWQLQRVIRSVEQNLKTSLQTSDLATEAGLSTSHFFCAFRVSTGRSPYAYIIERRIERAKKLMLSTENSLSDIALECGLTDQPHLSRIFKQWTGISPAAWRRLRQTVAGAPADHIQAGETGD